MFMTQRLQVLLDDSEFDEIREIARRHRMTVAEWVRQALRAARREEPLYDVEQKLAVLREAAALNYDSASGDIEDILRDIERSQLSEEL
jgi:predicted 2-oxoglutarate/Fe(II)-dependent dioxygenase YbiX